MTEVVKARKLIAICEDIAKSLKTYVEKNPDQEIFLEVDTLIDNSTHVFKIDVIGKGHSLSRAVDYREHF